MSLNSLLTEGVVAIVLRELDEEAKKLGHAGWDVRRAQELVYGLGELLQEAKSGKVVTHHDFVRIAEDIADEIELSFNTFFPGIKFFDEGLRERAISEFDIRRLLIYYRNEELPKAKKDLEDQRDRFKKLTDTLGFVGEPSFGTLEGFV